LGNRLIGCGPCLVLSFAHVIEIAPVPDVWPSSRSRNRSGYLRKKLAPSAKRKAVAHLQGVFEGSLRRAKAPAMQSIVGRATEGGDVLGVDRTMVRYRSQRPDETQARERIHALVGERGRFGYRRLHWLLGREGIIMSHRSSDGSIARSGCRCAAEAATNGRRARGR